MKKLLIAALSVFVLTNISFAQSLQQKIDSLESKIARLEREIEKTEQELKPYLQAKKAEYEAKRKKAEELYKQRFPEFVYFNISCEVKEYIINELTKDPKWDILDISFERESTAIIKSTSNKQGVAVNACNEDTVFFIKTALQWHKNPQESKRGKKLLAMQKDVKAYYGNFTGEYSEFLFKNKIFDLKCRRVSIYYKYISGAYLETINGNRYIFEKGKKPIVYAKCIIDKEIPIKDLIDHPFCDSGAISCLGKDSWNIKAFSPYVYRYSKPRIFEDNEANPSKDILEYNNSKDAYSDMKRIGTIDSLPEKHLKTFNIEDYM